MLIYFSCYKNKMLHLNSTLCISLLIFTSLTHAGSLLLENREEYEITLSGLIVYDNSTRAVHRLPGFDDNAIRDNRVFATGDLESVLFTGGSPTLLFAEHYISKKENITLLRHPPVKTPVRMVYAVATRLRDSVVLLIDGHKLQSLPMANESQFHIRDGMHPDLPDFFVGTDVDFATGEVTGAYTGNVIFLNGFTLTLTPD